MDVGRRGGARVTRRDRLKWWSNIAWILLIEFVVLWLVLIAINPDAALLPFLIGWDIGAWWYGVAEPSAIAALR